MGKRLEPVSAPTAPAVPAPLQQLEELLECALVGLEQIHKSGPAGIEVVKYQLRDALLLLRGS